MNIKITIFYNNNFIKNYLENNKTNSAIMLTGEWGSGKSHYIKNELVPYIENSDDKKCIIVSLYGINQVDDINKSIYFFIIHLRYNKYTSFQFRRQSVF